MITYDFGNVRYHLPGRHTRVFFEKLPRNWRNGLDLGGVPLVNILSATKTLGVWMNHGVVVREVAIAEHRRSEPP